MLGFTLLVFESRYDFFLDKPASQLLWPIVCRKNAQPWELLCQD